jgi:hypothetical protein
MACQELLWQACYVTLAGRTWSMNVIFPDPRACSGLRFDIPRETSPEKPQPGISQGTECSSCRIHSSAIIRSILADSLFGSHFRI